MAKKKSSGKPARKKPSKKIPKGFVEVDRKGKRKKKPRASTKGLRRRTDKRGRRYWIDKYGRRAKPGKRTLPPFRQGGKFAAHPIKIAARALRAKQITQGDFIGLQDPSDLSPVELADILKRAGIDPATIPGVGGASLDREGFAEPGSDFGEEDDDQGGEEREPSDAESVTAEAWQDMIDDLDFDEREFWQAYDDDA